MAEAVKIKTNANKKKTEKHSSPVKLCSEDQLLEKLNNIQVPQHNIDTEDSQACANYDDLEQEATVEPKVCTSHLSEVTYQDDGKESIPGKDITGSLDNNIKASDSSEKIQEPHDGIPRNSLTSTMTNNFEDSLTKNPVKILESSGQQFDLNTVTNSVNAAEANTGCVSMIESSDFPSAPLMQHERTSIEGLYVGLSKVEFMTETNAASLKALTDVQLDTLYHNQQLQHIQHYISQFLQDVKNLDKHEFYDIVLGYYRARNQLATAQHDIELLKSDADKLQDTTWQTQEFTVTTQGECFDKAKVCAPFKYEKQVFCEDSSEQLSDKFKEILNLLHDHLALSSYESQFSRLQVEVYLYRLYSLNSDWLEIPPGIPITAHIQRDPDLSARLAPLRMCISILFAFQRKPIKDTHFLKDTQTWLHRLVSTLLRFSCLEDHMFLLNQLLRCPAGVAKWSTQFIQPIAPPAIYPGILFGHPLLDHYVNMLAMLLAPIREREEMLYQLHVTVTPPTDHLHNPWILVDSDGEEDEDPSNSWHFLQENDLVSFLNQLPLSTIFRHVLGITAEQDGNEQYDPQSSFSGEGALLKMFAFATSLVTIVKKGMDTYCIPRYRQLNKRLARIISHVMGYVSDHLENCRTAINLLPVSNQERTQVEYDSLFFKAVSALLSSNRLGAWQFLADLPYEQVSESAIWKIFWKMHLSQESQDSNLDTLTQQECIEQIRDNSNLQLFEDRLVAMATSEALYLLNTFCNMARSRPSNTLFVHTVAMEIYQIAYLDVHTREFCSRQGKELLSSVCYKHAQIVSNLLMCTRETLDCVGKVGVFLYSGLPLWLWKPHSEDFLILQKWLVEFPIESVECHLARTILERLNWGQEVSEQGSVKLFLGQQVHYFMMSVISGSYMAHLTGYTPENLFTEKRKKSLLWGGQTEEDVMAQWLWDMALQTHININDNAHTLSLDKLPNIETDEKYLSVSAAKEKGFCIPHYFQLLSTKCGHSVEDFCCDGIEILLLLTEKGYMVPAIHALSFILPLTYVAEQQPRLINNTRFKTVLEIILKYDQSKRQMFSTEFPGQVTHLLASMIQKHFGESYEHASGNDLINFWLQILTSLTDWIEKRDILYILDNLLRAAHKIPKALELVGSVFTHLHEKYMGKAHPQGVLTSMTNWLAGNVGIPPLLDGAVCGEFPWLMYQILLAETCWEINTKLWPSLQEEIYVKEAHSIDNNLYKKVLSQLKLSNAPSMDKLSIYRWAEQIIATNVENRLLPLLCQNFFLLYLGRWSLNPGLPQRGSVGDRFFSSGHSLTLMKTMKQKLSDAAEMYQKLAVQDSEDSIRSLDKTLYHTLAKFFRGTSYWLDEPRLHETTLYIPSLPPQYEKELLAKVFQCETFQWHHLFDWSMIESQMAKLSSHWKDYFSTKVLHKNPVIQNEAPSSKIFNRLHNCDIPLPPPSVDRFKAPVAELPEKLISDKQNLIHSLRADFELLSGYAKAYDQRIQKHVALDCGLLELLPDLFKPQSMDTTVSIPCRSVINPLHRCKGPAAVNVSYEGTVRDDITSRKISENRAEYKQGLIESILPPSQHLCSSAVHVETTITELVKLYKRTNNPKIQAELRDVGCTLFYNVAAYVSEITKYYPPTRQFFSLCLEVIGQEFIRNNPSQAQPLLQTILQNPILVNMMSSSFSPNASPELFITMYEDLIPVPSNQGPDVALTLITKFGVKNWMKSPEVGLSQRQNLLHLIGRALGQCGQKPAKQTRAVCEVYKNHLIDLYEYQFPELYKDAINVLLSGTSSGQILVQVWEDFVQSLFSDPSEDKLQDSQMLIDICESSMSKTRIYWLAYPQIVETVNILHVHFHQLRMGNLASQGLYPRWRAYIEPLSIFMNAMCRRLIQWNVTWIQTGELTYSKAIPEVWKMLRNVVHPWLEVYIQDGPLSPWLQADIQPASVVMRMWITCVTLLHAEVKGMESSTSVTSPQYAGTIMTPLSLLWSWYVECMCKVEVPAHVLSVVHQHLLDAPWAEFVPTLTDLQNFNVVLQKNNEHCIAFVTKLVCIIPWNVYYKNILTPRLLQEDFITSVSFHVEILHLFVILPAKAKNKEIELAGVMQNLETCQWDIVDAQSFKHTAETYLQNCQANTLLLQRTHPSAMPLKFLKRGSSFMPTAENITLHPETPVKRVAYVKSVVELLCKCCADDEVTKDNLKITISNLLTDVESVVSTVTDAAEQKQCGLSLCMELINMLNICQKEKCEMFVATIIEWIDHSPTSILLQPLISAICRSVVHIPFMVQLTETCIDAHFTAGMSKVTTWAMVLSSLQVPELNLSLFINEAISQGSYLTLYAHVLQQLPFSQNLAEEFSHLKKLVFWMQEAKPCILNEHKLLVWWWQILKLSERQVQYGGSLPDIGNLLKDVVSILWSFGEDKDSAGFFGVIGLGKRSQLSVKFRVICKCVSTYVAAQLTYNNLPRINSTDPVLVKTAGSPVESKTPPVSPTASKTDQRHFKSTKQCLSHIATLTVNNKQYMGYTSQLQHAVDFIYEPDNTLLNASKLLGYFVQQLYSDKICLCDIIQ